MHGHKKQQRRQIKGKGSMGAYIYTFQRLDYTGKREEAGSMPQGPATPDLEAGQYCQRDTQKRDRDREREKIWMYLRLGFSTARQLFPPI